MRDTLRAILAVAGTASLFISSGASAASWRLAWATSNGNKGYVDLESVTSDQSTRMFREKMIIAEAFEGTAMIIADDRVDCTARTLQVTYLRTFDSDGKLKLEGVPSGATRPIKARSTAEGLLQFVC